jgi:hypothetical protein
LRYAPWAPSWRWLWKKNVFVLISDWHGHGNGGAIYRFVVCRYFVLFSQRITFSCLDFFVHRINKKGSQKDQEQKKSGAYFFYDTEENDDDDDDAFDDI